LCDKPQKTLLRGERLKTQTQPYVTGGRVLLGSRVPLSTRIAVDELAKREGRSTSAVVNEAVLRLLEERAIR
jgi:hypothetical protein